MLELLEGNDLASIGVLNLVIAALIFVLIEERVILIKKIGIDELLAKSILRNVVFISSILILISFFK